MVDCCWQKFITDLLDYYNDIVNKYQQSLNDRTVIFAIIFYPKTNDDSGQIFLSQMIF